MSEKEKYYVKLDGTVLGLRDNDQVPHEEFLDGFIEWLESKGYSWLGFSVQTDEHGNYIEDKVK
ncbi:hypothetical protein ACLHWY_27135 [Priestia aryabhattai]|uniref:hypothetical protein n=1 Tax=Priestia aryabhattai TaxID=412384 RepID=UPI003982FF2C